MLKKDEIHFFNDIAYYHVPFTHCPTGEQLRTDLRCHCNPKENFDWKGYSCELILHFLVVCVHCQSRSNISAGTSRFYELNGLEKPEGWEDQQS